MADTTPLVARRNRGHRDPFLQDFDLVSSRAYLYTPPAKEVQPEQQKLIILCTWMGASSRHLAKYTEQYIKRYPGIPLLLIRCTVGDVFLRRASAQTERMGAAATVIRNMQDKATAANTKLNVLLHVMSNGGSSTACVLNKVYKGLYPSTANGTGHSCQTGLPVSAMIVDSAPSLPHTKLAHNAIMSNVPKGILIRAIASAFFWFAIALIWIIDKVSRRTGFVAEIRNQLNDRNGPFLSKDVPRTYICGKGDKMVPMQDVVLHASEAVQSLGTPDAQKQIVVEEFVGSSHVMHMPSDLERYWNIVQDTWSKASS